MKRHVQHAVHHAKKITHHLRHKGILTRRKLLTFLSAINLIFILVIGTNILSFPNTMVGNANVGLMTKNAVRERLAKYYAASLPLTINAQSYDLTYEHIGVYMDPEVSIREIFLPQYPPIVSPFRATDAPNIHPATDPYSSFLLAGVLRIYRKNKRGGSDKR